MSLRWALGSVKYVVALGLSGYVFVRITAPSDDEMRKKLGVTEDENRSNTSLIMAQLKRSAGIKNDQEEGKRTSKKR